MAQTNLQENLLNFRKEIKHRLPEQLSEVEITLGVFVAAVVAVSTILIVLFFGLRKLKAKVLPSKNESLSKPRFRKRDKVLFYGRKMLRKVRSFTRSTIRVESGTGRGRIKKRQLVLKLAKKLLRMQKESQPQLQVKEPPQSFLEADLQELQDSSDYRLPAEVLYMLRSVRVFGHFEKPLFLELCKYMESRFVPAGSYLFKVGEIDDSIYVIQEGKIEVFVTEQDGTNYLMKEVSTGDSVHSLLSILDVLTGHPSPYKTVSATAAVDTTVLRLPAEAFQKMFTKYPESLVRVVQIIMVRLQRVTFMALHNYLGLSSELINKQTLSDRKLSIHSLSPRPSPQKTALPKLMSSLSAPASTTDDGEVTSDPGRPPAHSKPTDSTASSASAKPRHSSTQSEREYRGGIVDKGQEFMAAISDFDVACIRARVSSEESQPSTSSKSKPLDGSDPLVAGGRVRAKRSAGGASGVSTEQGDSEVFVKDEKQILELAKQDLITLLKLENKSLLGDKVHLSFVRAGTQLTNQGDQDCNLIFVVTGCLQMLQQVVGHSEQELVLFQGFPGDMVGTLGVLTGEPSFFTIRSKTDSIVAIISKSDFYSIMKEQPSVVLNVAHSALLRMSPFVRQIDFALDWMSIESGRALFRQGDNSDSLYIILTGRLRSVISTWGGKKELVGEYGRGELVGIVEVLTQTERATTVMAVRDTELAKVPSELLNLIKKKFPQVVTRLIHLLGKRILGSLHSRTTAALSEHPNMENRSVVANLATVAVLAISDDVPLTNFTLELQHALKAIGSTLRLTSDIVKNRLGVAALDSVNDFRLFNWLGQQEDIHRMVLYQCDSRVSKWTRSCIRQADCILIVGIADKDPNVLGEIEKQLESLAVRAQKELILLHREDAETPRNTAEWLNARGWCSSHHHIRCPKRVFSRKSLSKTMESYDKLFTMEPDRMSDFSRLARFLTGTSIGLVLGGGGARGCSHIGVIKAMMDSGIPIDMVGGTSMGAFIGALWCEERRIAQFAQRAREWCFEMGSLWKKILDLTYPATSMFTGAAFNRSIENVFKERQIEDLWIPYFCITTDITASKMRIHTSGSLWRYVRSSMSLSGYLPPLCDPKDGHLLLDGGYVNNLPADILRFNGAQKIFAIDVGSQDDGELTNYGDELSGWWLLWKRWNPWASPVRVPDMTEIQSRLAYVSCVRQLEIVKNSDYCEYIRPPIDRYGTLQFHSCDDIAEVGYNHGKAIFDAWNKSGLLKELFREKSREDTKEKKSLQHHIPVMASFTDLAELVSKIDEPRISSITEADGEYSGSEEEDEELITIESNPIFSTNTSSSESADATPTADAGVSEGNPRRRKPANQSASTV
ncbi:patatin-like phospholipase domain-containing protein 7 [Liolophura sinensis]|uniref:patatin-like phospholipase domain-containing protein 7 n=1 Tax=Liolophura sinensis TaxID=3198878 RepID=UPI0031596B30